MTINYSIFVSILILIFNTSCSDEISISKICQNTPELCSDIPSGGHCINPRSDVILKRYQLQQLPSDINHYHLLLAFEEYSRCIGKAAQIEHIKLKYKKSERVEGYVQSISALKQLSDATKNSNDPYLLYYHWSRNDDDRALRKFLALEKTTALDTPELQLGLASYYAKFDDEKTITTLYKALALGDQTTIVNLDIINTISSIFFKQNDYKKAYIWATIAENLGAVDVNIQQIKFAAINQNLPIDQLESTAQETLTSIQAGQFTPPQI